MAGLVLAAKLVLAAAFATSAAAKFRQPAAFRAALAGFGVPESAAPTIGLAVPPVEAGVALALVVLPAHAWPALLAVALLTTLTAAVVANLAAGRAAPCPCFDPGSDRPVSAATVVRNGLLLALAVIATGSTEGADPLGTVAATAVAVPMTLILLRRFG